MPKEFEKFWITQAGVIIKDNKCLILELADKPGYWDIPGGRVDMGEGDNSEAAFRREIKEELDVDNFKRL
ncbi:MAG TPA: NUDIX domain-containing protein [Patescibacteria group bacterium]|nr:NUDIX domain-containing protein [Patescibacteria group bacterium]